MLSVVIATRDRAGFLMRALTSLEAQSGAPAFEVVVADNGSSDGTAAEIAARADGPLRVTRVFVAEPNRAKARNAGVTAATGSIVVFIDDDVEVPPHFLAAHARAHARGGALAVSGPILNVSDYGSRAKPSFANYSGAFFCTCNVSLPRAVFVAAGGFDESFDLYGWEDTELGLRVRQAGVRRAFAWDAYLYHVKPPATETLEIVLGKTKERARMAARFLEKDRSLRTKLATGAYGPNLWRSRLTAPRWTLPLYASLARAQRVPQPLRALARAQLLDGEYTSELRRALRSARH